MIHNRYQEPRYKPVHSDGQDLMLGGTKFLSQNTHGMVFLSSVHFMIRIFSSVLSVMVFKNFKNFTLDILLD